MSKRLGILVASRDLVESLLPEGTAIDCMADMIGAVDYSVLERALLLPGNAKITGVSAAYRFEMGEVAFRIECPDFAESEEAGYPIPNVEAVYERKEDGSVVFCHWCGPAVTEGYRWSLVKDGLDSLPAVAPSEVRQPCVNTAVTTEPKSENLPRGGFF